MKDSANTTIDPTTTSFKIMKCLVESTLGKQVPSARELSSITPLFSYDKADSSITLFKNGFCLCQSIDGEKVFGIDRIKQICLVTPDNEVISIGEQVYSNGPCLIPLFIIGCASQRFNTEDFADIWQAFSEESRKP